MSELEKMESFSQKGISKIAPTIFVVDDEADTREILSAVFESSGYSVDVFESGESVLKALSESSPADLIILDLMMPGIDGLGTCSRIRSRFSSEQLPVIVASALDDNVKRMRALEIGANDYITKPFEPREVVKRAEIQLAIRKALKDSELRRRSLEVLFETIPIGVVQIGITNEIAIINPVAKEILQLDAAPTAEEVRLKLGFDPLKRVTGEDGPIAEDRKYMGGTYHIDCRAIEADGKLLGCLTVLRDITREASLDDLKTEFAQVVSHELRTPLTAINNAVSVLAGPEHIPQEIHEKLFSIVKRNTDRMMSMVKDLLDLSKMETGRIELTLVEGSVVRIADHTVEALKHLAQNRKVGVRHSFSEDFPQQLFMDTAAVERVLTNLVSNAIKYTNENTEVRIEGSLMNGVDKTEREPRAELLHSFARGYVEIRVSDQGFGVPTGEKERIFEKFVRVPRQVYGDTSGTGLGLPIAQNLVRAHGGDLWVESTPGRGASFIFRLPIFDRYGALAVSIADKLCTAKRDRRSLGIIVLRLFCDKEIAKRNGFSWDAAGDLAKVAKGALLRSSDYAVFNPHLGEIVVILEGCMQEVLPQVGVRVSSEIRRHFRECCPEIKPAVTAGHAYSPPSSTLEQAMATLSEARAKAAANQESRRHVLIVDDDELFAMSTARVLGMFHFKTTCVSTADEALAVIEREPPDLVILDIMMPGHDGFRLGRELKNRADLKHIPIVFISALERDETLNKVFASGGSEFLQKPIEAADLIKTIKIYLE